MNQIDMELSLHFSIDQKCDYEITPALYDLSDIHKLQINHLSILRSFLGTNSFHSDIWIKSQYFHFYRNNITQYSISWRKKKSVLGQKIYHFFFFLHGNKMGKLFCRRRVSHSEILVKEIGRTKHNMSTVDFALKPRVDLPSTHFCSSVKYFCAWM